MGLTKVTQDVLDKHGRKNAIINGNFDIWQRGTSQTGIGYGSDDRWINGNFGSTKTHSRSAFTVGQTEVPNNPKYFSRTVVASVAGSGNYTAAWQKIEGVDTFADESVTLSFWAKADAPKNIATELEQDFGTGGSPSSTITGIGVTQHSLTTTWQQFTVTVSMPSISGKTLGTDNNDSILLVFWLEAGTNFNASTNSLGQQSGTFDIAQVQIEKGTTATEFEHRTIGEELILCQRYFTKSYNVNTNPGTIQLDGAIHELNTRNHATATPGASFVVEMRATPTIMLYSPDTGASGVVSNSGDKSAVALNPSKKRIRFINSISGGAIGNSCRYQYTADAEI